MSIECGACGRKSTLWLCSPCQDELKEMLSGLPRWINHLEEAALGQTRLGESARRAPGDNRGPIPFNGRASELYDNVHDCLQRWTLAINHNYETLGES
jgi:hypothetical protein